MNIYKQSTSAAIFYQRNTMRARVYAIVVWVWWNHHCIKMAKCRMMQQQTIPHDSARTLVCWCQRSRWNSNVVISMGAPNAGGVDENQPHSTNDSL